MGFEDRDGQTEELELLSEDTTWRKMAAVQLLLLTVVGIWALADLKPELMIFSLIPLFFFFIYVAWSRGSAKRLKVGPTGVFFEKLSGKKGEINRELVEKIEVRRTPAMTSVTVLYRRGQERGRLVLKTAADQGDVAKRLREMGYGVAGESKG